MFNNFRSSQIKFYKKKYFKEEKFRHQKRQKQKIPVLILRKGIIRVLNRPIKKTKQRQNNKTLQMEFKSFYQVLRLNLKKIL